MIPRLEIAERLAEAPALPGPVVSDGHVWHDQDGEVWAYHDFVDGRHWVRFPGLASFCFDGHTDRVEAIPHVPAQSALIRETYHHSILPMVLQVRGMEVLHASAVLAPQGVLALCARSGTGKSTLAYGLRRRGYPLWADDTMVFEAASSRPHSVPLSFQPYLLPDAAAAFRDDHSAAAFDASGTGSSQVHGDPRPLAAVLVLQRLEAANDAVAVDAVRLRPHQAFPAVLSHACCLSLGEMDRKRRMMVTYLELSATVPIFELRFRPGLERLAEVLDHVEHVARQAARG